MAWIQMHSIGVDVILDAGDPDGVKEFVRVQALDPTIVGVCGAHVRDAGGDDFCLTTFEALPNFFTDDLDNRDVLFHSALKG